MGNGITEQMETWNCVQRQTNGYLFLFPISPGWCSHDRRNWQLSNLANNPRHNHNILLYTPCECQFLRWVNSSDSITRRWSLPCVGCVVATRSIKSSRVSTPPFRSLWRTSSRTCRSTLSGHWGQAQNVAVSGIYKFRLVGAPWKDDPTV